jgi:adenylate cyclase
MSLHLEVVNDSQRSEFVHPAGPLELGRGSQRDVPRHVIQGDKSVSRDQLRLEEVGSAMVRLENLSATTAVMIPGVEPIPPSQSRDVRLPLTLTVGMTRIAIRLDPLPADDSGNTLPPPAPVTPSAPPPGLRSLPSSGDTGSPPPAGAHRTHSPTMDEVGGIGPWLERIIGLQKSAGDSREFHDKAARALVDLVGLDLGLVLLQQASGAWSIAGSAVDSDMTTVRYSRTLLEAVVAQRRTFFDDIDSIDGANSSASLTDVESGVASPVFGTNDDVVGVLYGVRTTQGLVTRGPITALDAQLVQLLAGSIGATLARSTANRARATFEQFFTRELSEQLALNPDLLDGRDAEVSLLFCDIRGFSRVSERLGSAGTMEWVRDVMGVLSDCVLAHSGVLVDYIGDEMIAMWGAPVAQEDHASLACRAAIDMLAALPGLDRRWAERIGEPTTFGIGINSGIACVGNTGSRHKFKYGPLGNTVNLASRVQGATKYVRSPILVTGATRARLGGRIATRRICRVRVVNISEPVDLHELGHPDDPGWEALQRGYEGALTAFEKGDFHTAAHILGGLLRERPNDGPSLLLLSRVANCLVAPDDDFEPCWVLPGK